MASRGEYPNKSVWRSSLIQVFLWQIHWSCSCYFVISQDGKSSCCYSTISTQTKDFILVIYYVLRWAFNLPINSWSWSVLVSQTPGRLDLVPPFYMLTHLNCRVCRERRAAWTGRTWIWSCPAWSTTTTPGLGWTLPWRWRGTAGKHLWHRCAFTQGRSFATRAGRLFTKDIYQLI